MPPKQETFQDLCDQFASFLIVAIHLIAYERHLYPQESFMSARAYDFAVRQSRHPGVCTWITDAVSAVVSEIANGTVARVAFAIFHPRTNQVLERFVWDVSSWPVVQRTDHLTPLIRERDKSNTGRTQGSVDLEEQLRAVLNRLSTCSFDLQPIPSGCPFTLAVELKQDADPPINHPRPWVPSEPDLQRTKHDDASELSSHESIAGEERLRRGSALGGSKTIPIRNVEAGEMRLSMWVEEAAAKEMQVSMESTSATSNSAD